MYLNSWNTAALFGLDLLVRWISFPPKHFKNVDMLLRCLGLGLLV